MKSGTKIHRYTKEQDEFLKENREKYTLKQLTDVFNAKYKSDTTRKSIEFRCLNTIKIVVQPIHKYTEKEKVFLYENREKFSNKKLTKIFNREFSTDLKVAALDKYCIANFGKKQIRLPGIKKGDRSELRHPIGAEVVDSSGYISVKTNDFLQERNYRGKSKNWTKKHNLIYERVFGKIPDGNVVVFLDSDKANFDLDNLYCTKQGIIGLMNQNSWFSTNPEQTLTAIKYCELFYALKESKEKA